MVFVVVLVRRQTMSGQFETEQQRQELGRQVSSATAASRALETAESVGSSMFPTSLLCSSSPTRLVLRCMRVGPPTVGVPPEACRRTHVVC